MGSNSNITIYIGETSYEEKLLQFWFLADSELCAMWMREFASSVLIDVMLMMITTSSSAVSNDDDDDKYIMIQCLSVTFLFIPAPTPAPPPRPELLCLDKT